MSNQVTKLCPICASVLNRIAPDSYTGDVWQCSNCSLKYSSGVSMPDKVSEEKSFYRQGFDAFKDDKVIPPSSFDKNAPVKAYQDYYRGALDAQIESVFDSLKADFLGWSQRNDIDADMIVGTLNGIKFMFRLNGLSK